MKAFVWTDLETTGLDLVKDDILEVACTLTDFKLQHLSDMHFYLTSDIDPMLIVDVVREMHTTSGLWADLETAPRIKPHIGDNILTDWLNNLVSVYNITEIQMAGSAVGQYDLQLARRDFPKFSALLSHRVFDTRTLKTLQEMCGQEIEQLIIEPKHRARSDNATELAYARNFFNPWAETSAFAQHVEKTME